jgi:hypothetical protein
VKRIPSDGEIGSTVLLKPAGAVFGGSRPSLENIGIFGPPKQHDGGLAA